MLKLIKGDELNKIELAGAVFYWARPSWAERQRVLNVMRGIKKPDEEAEAGTEGAEPEEGGILFMVNALVPLYLKKWEGIGFDETEETEYGPELVQALPYDVVYQLAQHMGIIGAPSKKDQAPELGPDLQEA